MCLKINTFRFWDELENKSSLFLKLGKKNDVNNI